MKRLIKKAEIWDPNNIDEIDIEDLEFMLEDFDDWLGTDADSVNLMWAMETNPDCIYSGELYRCIGINSDKLYSNIKFPISKMDFIDKIKNSINNNKGSEISYTKEVAIAEMWKANDINEASVVIKSNTQGLDINKFYEKWKDIINDMGYLFNYEKYLHEKEVVCKYTNDFDIYSISGYTENTLPDEIDEIFYNENILKNL